MTAEKPWEPDPQKMGNWRAMFEQPRQGSQPAGEQPASPKAVGGLGDEPLNDEGATPDLSVYKPWILQRGRSRPALMLDFRRYEPRSGLWSGWAMAYPHLVGLAYTGDRLLSLDFGKSQVILEGGGLDELARHLQQGSVTAILEYSAHLWPVRLPGPIVTCTRQIGGDSA